MSVKRSCIEQEGNYGLRVNGDSAPRETVLQKRPETPPS